MVNSLETWSDAVRSAWGPLSSELVSTCRERIAQLVRSAPDEEWLASLLRDRPAQRELYRDPEHGFMLLAHTETAGLYRTAHDHGRGWVIYAVVAGVVEMSSYARLPGGGAEPRLVKRDSTLMCPGQVQVYLPGDIHDTNCLTGSALLLRFTERDLREEKNAGYVTRYVERGARWTAEAA